MQTLLIVGHPSSGCQLIEDTLFSYGMSEANLSSTYLLSPKEICTKLLKTKDILFQNSTDFHQIESGAIWNELALDLLLGNIEQSFWGWSDYQSIYFLDYWRLNEPKIKFILVYSPPEEMVVAFKNKKVTAESLQAEIKQWENYNKEIVRFYLSNVESCLLVHSDKVRKDTIQFIELVSVFLDRSFTKVESKGVLTKSVKLNNIDLAFAQNLIEPLLSAQDSYEELQSISNMPVNRSTRSEGSNIDAWNNIQTYQEKFMDLQEENKLIMSQLHEAQEEIEQHYLEEKKRKDILSNNSQQTFKEVEQENELLLLQLHQVQEELEHYYLLNQKLESGKSLINTSLGTKKIYYGAADRIKGQLSYRLGACMIEQSRSIRGWVGMPLAFWSAVNQFNSEKVERDKLPPTARYQDVFEAESVKKHLSYRLGSTMLSHLNSPIGWVKLPFSLRKEIVDFQRERSEK